MVRPSTQAARKPRCIGESSFLFHSHTIELGNLAVETVGTEEPAADEDAVHAVFPGDLDCLRSLHWLASRVYAHLCVVVARIHVRLIDRDTVDATANTPPLRYCEGLRTTPVRPEEIVFVYSKSCRSYRHLEHLGLTCQLPIWPR